MTILDDHLIETQERDKYYLLKILMVIIVSFILSKPLTRYYTSLILNVFDGEINQNTLGFFILFYYSAISCYVCYLINKGRHESKKIQIAIFTGLVIFLIELLVLTEQNWSGQKGRLTIDAYQIIKAAAVWGIIAGLMSNVMIHKLREKSIGEPVIVLVISYVVIAYLSQLSPYSGW